MLLLDTRNRLTPADRKQHLGHRFTVPAGVTGLRIVLDWDPRRTPGVPGDNVLGLSLFDPAGFRGAGHNRVDASVVLTPGHATPGYLAGPVAAGEWDIVLDTHGIVSPLHYQITVDGLTTPVAAPSPRRVIPAPARKGPAWFRGDLHGHTRHSDGHWDTTDLLAFARARGLDFVTLSDHNTISPLAEWESLATPELLTIGGMELTTFYGHALALGVRRWFDWRVRPGDGSMPRLAHEIGNAGGLFVIAHPMSPGDPVCTGCDWRYTDMMPGDARLVEIWNGGVWSEFNEQNLALWYLWLNQGVPMKATAGTDIHGPLTSDEPLGLNMVYAPELSERAVLAAVRKGHSYLSSGPTLQLNAISSTDRAGMMGDHFAPGPARLTAAWDNAPAGASVHWIVDGARKRSITVAATDEDRLALTDNRWCTVELRDRHGTMLAVANPCWFGLGPAPRRTSVSEPVLAGVPG